MDGVACRLRSVNRRFLLRLNRTALCEAVEALAQARTRSPLSFQQAAEMAEGGKSREDIATCLLDTAFKDGMTYDEVALVDMSYFQQKARVFNALEIVERDGLGMRDSIDMDTLQAKVSAELKPFMKQHTYAKRVGDRLWLRVASYDDISARAHPSFGQVAVFVIVPRSHFVAVSSIRRSLHQYIYQAVASGLGCEMLKPIELSVNGVDSLFAVLNEGGVVKSQPQLSEGASSVTSSTSADNPLDRRTKRKRKREKAPEVEVIADGVFHEEGKERAKRKRKHDKNYGTAPPELDTVKFEAATQYKGDSGVDFNGLIICKAQFKGTNILGGLLALAKRGSATDPLPAFWETFCGGKDGEVAGPSVQRSLPTTTIRLTNA